MVVQKAVTIAVSTSRPSPALFAILQIVGDGVQDAALIRGDLLHYPRRLSGGRLGAFCVAIEVDAHLYARRPVRPTTLGLEIGVHFAVVALAAAIADADHGEHNAARLDFLSSRSCPAIQTRRCPLMFMLSSLLRQLVEVPDQSGRAVGLVCFEELSKHFVGLAVESLNLCTDR